jgi:integrase
MTLITSFDLDTVFVHPDAPNFAALITQLNQADTLSKERRRDLISGLRRLAKALGRPVEAAPADPRWLRPRIVRVAPVAVGLSTKSWTNVVSDAKAAMAQCGILEPKSNHRSHLSQDWSCLWGVVLKSGPFALQPALGRFVHFMSRLGVAPAEVDDRHAALYREALERNEVAKDTEAAWRSAICGWNRAQVLLPEWPRRRLSLPSRTNHIVLPLSTFPESFRADLDVYMDRRANPDPLAEDAPRRLRPSTLEQLRLQIVRFASALVHAGERPESLVDLAALVEPERAERGLRWLGARSGSTKTHVIAGAAEMLRLLARDYVKADALTQEALDHYAGKLKIPRQPGLTAKNRTRLRQLEDPAALHRLLRLPEQLMAAADAQGTLRGAHLLREDAVAVAILLHCPIRAGNLGRIHLGRNLQRPGGGRVFLVFEAGEVKNDRGIEFELPKAVLVLIDRYLASRSPALCPQGTPWLFPRRDGALPIDQAHLAKKVCETIWRETGLEWNLHLFRHLAAKLWLEANPGGYEALRRILGHSALSLTLDFYAGFEAASATKAFADLLEARRLA